MGVSLLRTPHTHITLCSRCERRRQRVYMRSLISVGGAQRPWCTVLLLGTSSFSFISSSSSIRITQMLVLLSTLHSPPPHFFFSLTLIKRCWRRGGIIIKNNSHLPFLLQQQRWMTSSIFALSFLPSHFQTITFKMIISILLFRVV